MEWQEQIGDMTPETRGGGGKKLRQANFHAVRRRLRMKARLCADAKTDKGANAALPVPCESANPPTGTIWQGEKPGLAHGPAAEDNSITLDPSVCKRSSLAAHTSSACRFSAS